MAEAPRAVVLSGYYGFGNVGDDALFAALTAALHASGTTRIVVPAGPLTDRLDAPPGVEWCGRTDWATIRGAFRAGAALVSGGGGLLQNATSQRSLIYYLTLFELARRAGRPAAICAQSIGPLHGWLARRWTARVARQAAAISVRDELSAAALTRLGIPRERILTTVDPAFALPLPPAAPTVPGRLGICLRPTAATATVVAAFRDWLPHRPAGTHPLWLACQAADEAVHQAVTESGSPGPPAAAERRSDSERRSTAPPPGELEAGEARPARSVAETLADLAGCELVISERLHPLIFALACGVPAVAIDYDPKVRGLALDHGLPLAGRDATLDGRQLTESVAQAWRDRAALGAASQAAGEAARARIGADLRAVFGALVEAESGCYTETC